MALDGTGARDAPWQLPCHRMRVNRDFVDMPARHHPFLELHSVTGNAVLVFTDAPNPVIVDAPGISLSVLGLTPAGRRGTPIENLAPPEALPASYLRSTNDGDELAAIYADDAPGREGWWLRRFRYSPTPP